MRESAQPVSLCTRTLEIPDISDMNARVGIVAWENGLDDFEVEISKYVLQALKVFSYTQYQSTCIFFSSSHL